MILCSTETYYKILNNFTKRSRDLNREICYRVLACPTELYFEEGHPLFKTKFFLVVLSLGRHGRHGRIDDRSFLQKQVMHGFFCFLKKVSIYSISIICLIKDLKRIPMTVVCQFYASSMWWSSWSSVLPSTQPSKAQKIEWYIFW